MLKSAPRILFHPAVRAGAGAVIAAGLAVFFFAPRFGLWRGLDIPAWLFYPEVNRAVDALKQVQHPFAPIENPANMVLQWRLLFPLLAHALSLPAWAYLALPHVGCLLVLGFVVRLLERRGTGWPAAVTAALLVATCSWFFVATGWLAYFDSWCVLGLLVVAFSESRAAVLGAVLATPWIDERFVFALPLTLFARGIYASLLEQRPPAFRRREFLWLAAALLPWALIRGGFYLQHSDQVTVAYARDMLGASRSTNAASYASGLWQGLRWAWVLPVVVLAWAKRDDRMRAAATLGVMAGTLVVVLAIATDLSRAGSAVVPFVVLGVMVLHRHSPARLRPVLAALGVLNLLSPAKHVIGNDYTQLFYFYTELENTRRPPAEVAAQTYNDRAKAIADNRGLPEALELLNTAIQLDPAYAQAYSNRAMVHYRLGHVPEALADADRGLALAPDRFGARYNRGLLRAAIGDLAGAQADLERVLHEAPYTWGSRAEAEANLRGIRQRLEKR